MNEVLSSHLQEMNWVGRITFQKDSGEIAWTYASHSGSWIGDLIKKSIQEKVRPYPHSGVDFFKQVQGLQ